MCEPKAVTLGALALVLLQVTSYAQNPMACAWEVSGEWHVHGRAAALKAGDLVPPRSLVTGEGAGSQHLIMLMPDGQRLFLDCHDQSSCSEGFRLPALIEHVDEETINTFQQVSALRTQEVERSGLSRNGSEENLLATREQPDLTRVEAVAALGNDGSVNLAPAIKELPPGDYRLIIKNNSGSMERSIHWDGKKKALSLSLNKAGLYDLRFYGTLNAERMHGCLLVVRAKEFDSANDRLVHERETLTNWNERSPGWPIHEFLFLYLEALNTQLSMT